MLSLFVQAEERRRTIEAEQNAVRTIFACDLRASPLSACPIVWRQEASRHLPKTTFLPTLSYRTLISVLSFDCLSLLCPQAVAAAQQRLADVSAQLAEYRTIEVRVFAGFKFHSRLPVCLCRLVLAS